MADPHIISTLDRAVIETQDRIEEYRRLLQEAEADLVHVRATISFLARHVSGRNAKGSTMSVARLFQRGEVFTRVVQAMRESGPELTTSELAAFCLRSKNLDPDEAPLRRAMAQNLVQVLKLREAKGEIISPGKKGVVRIWCLPRTN